MHTINGKAIEVEVHGDGEAVLMVHGLGGSSNVWGPQAALLSRWFKVIRPDLDSSARSSLNDNVSIVSYADDLAAVLDTLKVESFHLMGHSMGTTVCQRLAAKMPERVKSLVLLGPIHAPADGTRNALRDRAAKVRGGGLVEVADAIAAGAVSAETKAARPEVAAFVRELVMRQSPEGYARSCEALAAAQGSDLSAIHCPVLVITGDEDGVSPPAAAKKVAAMFPQPARTIILPRCGHWQSIERPAEVNEAIVNFLFS